MDKPTSGGAVTTPVVVSAVFLGAVAFLAGWAASTVVGRLAPEGAPTWMGVFVHYGVMLAVTLVLVLASSMGNPGRFGFRMPTRGGYGSSVVPGLALGAAASVVGLLAGGGGIGGSMSDLNFLEIVLLVWVLASVTEEVLVRGYVQGYLEPLADRGFTVFGLRLSLPVLLSALFFSAMHLILLTTDTSHVTVCIILVFTFALGLLAAYQRERSGSLLRPIAVHVSFNVGGTIGAILFVIAQVVLFGKSAAEVLRAVSG